MKYTVFIIALLSPLSSLAGDREIYQYLEIETLNKRSQISGFMYGFFLCGKIDLFCGKDSYAKYKVDSMDCIEAVEGLKAERIRNAISNVNSVRPDAVSEYPVVGIRLQCYKYLGLDPKCEKRYDQRFFEKNDFMALMDKEIECQIKEKVGKSRIFDFQGRELKAR